MKVALRVQTYSLCQFILQILKITKIQLKDIGSIEADNVNIVMSE